MMENVLTNTMGARNLFLGSAANGRSTWLSAVGAGGADYHEVSSATIINPLGGVGITLGARMSDEATGLQSIFGGQTLLDLDVVGSTKRSWGWYDQTVIRAGFLGGHLQRESSVANFGPTVDSDPWDVNRPGRTVHYRFDAGIGPDPYGHNDPLYATPNAVSTFIDMVNNGGPGARNGIVVGVKGLDTTGGRVAPLALMPPNVSVTWNIQKNTKAWDVYSSATGAGSPKSINLRSNDVLVNADWSLTSPLGTERSLKFFTDGSSRWFVGKTATTESGQNTGSDFGIARFNDAGAYQGIPFLIRRSDGEVQAPNLVASTRLVVPFGTVASSTAPCAVGQIQIDASFIYTCVATNSWRRLSSGAAW